LIEKITDIRVEALKNKEELNKKIDTLRFDTNEKFEQIRSDMRQQFRWIIGSVIVNANRCCANYSVS